MVSAPKAPDPVATANAQAGMNRDTATTQQMLNMTNQVTPDGTLNYQQTGSTGFTDASGKWITLPQFTATQTLSPQQQAIKDQTDSASLNLGTIANEQSASIRDHLNTNFEYGNDEAEQWAYDLGSKRLDPRFASEQDALRTQLISSGIRPGTAAYDQQMGKLGETKNDAYNQLMLTGRQQGFTEALTQRNQPLNEISALMSGSQVSMPQFASTPQTGVGGVDYTGLVNSKYQADSANHQAKMGGMFGLLSGGIGLLSDRRAKTGIRAVGRLENGLTVYSYCYKGGTDTHIGLMADEVERVHPEAVAMGPDGFNRVRYDLAVEAA